jgi:hypothetical protein
MRLQILAAFAVIALATAGCASSGGTEAESSPRVDGGITDVLRFSAPKLGGGSIEGEDYSGRDVALWFWAPW